MDDENNGFRLVIMRNIKIVVEYDGTGFSGWQVQPEARTVQGEIERTLAFLTSESIRIDGSGRTDAGVHALGQVATFKTQTKIPNENLMRVLNHHLPEDITIKALEEVEHNFHARYHACGKHYQYRIYNAPLRSSLLRNYNWHIKKPLAVDSMLKAIPYLVGEKDFKCFMATGSTAKTTVRNVYEIDAYHEGDFLVIDFKGNGFLYNMVRNMTRLLVDIGTGKESIARIPEIIASGDRSKIKRTAPACGLYLVEVYYNQ